MIIKTHGKLVGAFSTGPGDKYLHFVHVFDRPDCLGATDAVVSEVDDTPLYDWCTASFQRLILCEFMPAGSRIDQMIKQRCDDLREVLPGYPHAHTIVPFFAGAIKLPELIFEVVVPSRQAC